jgi:hypothetical protein
MPSTGRDWKISRNIFGQPLGASRGIIESEDLSNTRGGLPIPSFASVVRDETVDGAELVEFVLGIFRGRREADVRTRLDAATWLANRAFGRVPSDRELRDMDYHFEMTKFDLRRIETSDLAVLEILIGRGSARP